jgi:hypothetical protein
MNIWIVLIFLLVLLSTGIQIYTLKQLNVIQDRLPSSCGQFTGNDKYGKSFYNHESYIQFTSTMINSGKAEISLKDDEKKFENIHWTYNKQDCSVTIEQTDELIKYLKDEFKAEVDNKVKFDENNNLLVDIKYPGGKTTLRIPHIKE